MKKIISLFLFIIFALIFPVFSQASMRLVYDGQTHTYTEKPVYLFINGEQLNPDMPPILFGGTTVVPARAVFEKLGAKVTWDSKTSQVFIKSDTQNIILKINDPMAVVNGQKQKSTLPAKIINNSTMIPLRFVSEKLGMDVEWDGTNRYIKINNKTNDDINIEDVAVSSQDGKTLVKVEASGAINEYSKLELSSPDRIVLDFPNSTINTQQCSLTLNDNTLQKIRSAQYEVSPNKARIVLDLSKKTNYSISFSDDKKLLMIGIISDNANSGDKTNDSSSDDENVSTVTIGNKDDFDSLNKNMDTGTSIKLINENASTGIRIETASAKDCKVSRITDENAIAVDNIDTSFKTDKLEIPVTDKLVKFLRQEKLSDGTGRLLIGMEDQLQYQVYQAPGSLEVYVSTPEYKNISYKNDKGVSTITINSDIKNEISSSDIPENNSTVFTIPNDSVDLGEGNMQINDDLINSLEIKNNSSETTSLVVNYNYNGAITYNIAKDNSDNTIISITKKEEIKVPAGNYLVVIDAGHGGYDPGAKYKDEVLEKDLNLDIALKLNKLLQDAGVKTIMTRDKDVFVPLHDRADIANNANADLFVSIHNNWIEDSSISGTQTLYYPSTDSSNGLSPVRFADITQEQLLEALGSVNRKTVPRPNLVVLNSTNMPAVLAEIGFISNADERSNLTSSDYQEKAAQGLCNAVIKALGEINKE